MQANGSTGGLLQGVSQQPVNVRQPGQCTEQINAVSDVVQGWKRRPPTDYLAQLFADLLENIKWSFYDTGTEHYILCFIDGEVRVFDLDGTQKTVNNAGVHTYLDSANPFEDISTVTIGDYTVVANRQAVPALSDEITAPTPGALVVVRAGEWGRTFKILIDGVNYAEFTTPAGDSPATQAVQTAAGYIAAQLYSAFSTARTDYVVRGFIDGDTIQYSGSPYALRCAILLPVTAVVTSFFVNGSARAYERTASGLTWLAGGHVDQTWEVQYSAAGAGANIAYNVEISANVLLVTRADGLGTDPIDISISDDKNNDLAYIVQETVPTFGQLPRVATPDMIVQVKGDAKSGDDDLYVKFVPDMPWGTFGSTGTWVETAAPRVQSTIDPTTMPHILVRLPSGDFYFGAADASAIEYETDVFFKVERWLKRDAGDEILNPAPGFIGEPIRALGSYQNRLVILAGESLSMSRTSSYFNFWRETATALLDTDTISITSTYGEYSPLVHAIQHNRALVLLSPRVQFIVKSPSGITPKNAAIEVSTAFEADLSALPVVAGENLFFGIQKGTYAGLRELFTQSDIDSNTTRPVTDHIERYIPGRVRSMASSANLDTLVVNTTPATNFLYIYKYLWQGAERVQSAWSKWQFPSTWEVLYTFFNDAYLYVVYQDTGGVHLIRMDMTDLPLLGLTHNLYLDARLQVTPTAGAVTLPYAEYGDVVVVAGPDAADPGRIVQVLDSTAGVLTLDWDEEGSVVVGKAMRTSYIPTIAGVKDSQGRYMANAELVLGELLVHYRNSGGFVGKLSSPFYDDVEVVADRSAGELSSELAGAGEDSDVFRMPVYMKADKNLTVEFYTEGVLPWNMLDIEWVGQYTRKGWRA
jgi:hypothetical protein